MPPVGSAQTVLAVALPENVEPAARTMLNKLYVACGLDAAREVFECPISAPASFIGALPAAPLVPFVVSFGLAPKHLGAQWVAAPYAWLHDGGRAYCFAERPELIADDLERKKRLWACLKAVKASRVA